MVQESHKQSEMPVPSLAESYKNRMSMLHYVRQQKVSQAV